jgi:phospholipase C
MEARRDAFGKDTAGSPFTVYAPGEYLSLEAEKKQERVLEAVRAWHFAVSPGDALTEDWPLDHFKDGQYHLRLYGPNGFFREYAGNANEPRFSIHCGYESNRPGKSRPTGNIELVLGNADKDRSYEMEITDNTYQAAPVRRRIRAGAHETVIIDLQQSGGWYDFSVNLQHHPEIVRRFAGRVETGKESITDPAMGRSV